MLILNCPDYDDMIINILPGKATQLIPFILKHIIEQAFINGAQIALHHCIESFIASAITIAITGSLNQNKFTVFPGFLLQQICQKEQVINSIQP